MGNEKNLSARDISSIIKACKSSGVHKLLYGDLTIEFRQETVTSQDKPELHLNFVEEETKDSSFASSIQSDQEDPHHEIDDLIITNPTAWEEYRSKQE